jgi:replicative DNA helicase
MTAQPPEDDLWGPDTELSPPGMPPFDVQAEGAVIWAALFRPGAMAKLAPMLEPGDFYSEAHHCYWEGLQALFASGQELTLMALAAWLRGANKWDRSGREEYLTDLSASAPVVGRPVAVAETLQRLSRARLALKLCQSAEATLYQPSSETDAFLDSLARDLEKLRARGRKHRAPLPMQEAHKTAYENAEARAERREPRGLSTGLEAIDRKIGGLGAGELTILAGRPGMGKTALALRIADYVARAGNGVLFVSLEMPSDQLSARLLCSEAGISLYNMRAGLLTGPDWSALTATYMASMTRRCPLLFWEWPVTALELGAVVKDASAALLMADASLKLVVVDHIQLVRHNGHAGSREESVSEAVRGLKSLALDVGCHVLALSQLNRGVESRPDKRPLLSDLRESGAIEEAADTVASLYRAKYYDKKQPEGADVGFLKNRNGPTGVASLAFDPLTITFSDLPEAR